LTHAIKKINLHLIQATCTAFLFLYSMRKIIWYCCFVLCIPSGFTQSCKYLAFKYNTDPVRDKICASALIEDLKELKERLYEIHPDLHRYTMASALDSAFLQAIDRCSTDKTLLEFTQILNDYLQELRDSHTFFNVRELLSYSRFSRHYLPFMLHPINDKVFVVKSWKSIIPTGSELLAFNKIEPRYFRQTAMDFTPIEAHANHAKKELSINVFCGLSNLQTIKKRAEVDYVYKGDTVHKEVSRPRLRKAFNSTDFLGEEAKITYNNFGKKGVLSISSFSPTTLNSFKKRMDEVFKDIEMDSIESLAIDLRNNTGGYILLQEYLMSFLVPEGIKYSNYYVYKRSNYDRFEQLSKVQKWRFRRTARRYYPNGAIAREWDFYNSPKGTIDTVFNDPILLNKNRRSFSGKCTLFINGMSMSASANFAAWFAAIDRGVIVGTPASGTYTGTFANPVTIYLNNTALPVMISTMKVNAFDDPTSNKSIEPSVLLTPTISDIQAGKDIHLSYFLTH